MQGKDQRGKCIIKNLIILMLLLLTAPAAQAQSNNYLYSAGHAAPAFSRSPLVFYHCHFSNGTVDYCKKTKFTGSKAVVVERSWGSVIAKGEGGAGLPVPYRKARICKFSKGKITTCSMYAYTGNVPSEEQHRKYHSCYSKSGSLIKCSKTYYTGWGIVGYHSWDRPPYKEDISE